MPPPTQTPPDSADAQDIDYTGESAKKLAQRCIDECARDTALVDRHKQDWLNLLFDRGGEDNQWVTWDQTSDAWVRIPTDGDYGLPADVPRACTNVFANKCDGITGILNQSDPAQEWRPASDDDEDLATAEVAGDIIPALLEEIGYPELKPVINKGVTLTDKIALILYYDRDPKHGESLVQAFRCLGCGTIAMPMDIEEAGDTCPKCGLEAKSEGQGDDVTENFEPAVDSMFNQIGMNYPIGKLCAEFLSSFEFSLPPNSQNPHADENAYVVTHKRYTDAEFLDTWGQEFKDVLQKSSSGSGKRQADQYADALRALTSPHTANQHSGGREIHGTLVHRVFHDPITTDEFHFPEGLYIALCGNEVLDAGALPVHGDKSPDGTPGIALKPVLTRTFRRQFGTAAGKPPADDLVPLQRQRNLWETIAALIGLRYAMPTTYIPTTVTLETPITGLPQPEVYYRSHDGSRPQTGASHADASFCFEMIDRIDKKMDELSNLNSILQGDRPEGDPTLGEVQRLEDRAYGQFKTTLDELIRFEKNLSIMLLRFARETLWAPRMAKIRGENDQWEVSQFTNADLAGHVDVYVNPISAWPKSQVMQQLRMQKAIELGLIAPQDPELQVKVLSDWNLAHLKTSLDVDRKQIARMLDRWKAATSPADIAPPQPPPLINPAMHLHYVSQFLKTEEAEALQIDNPPVFQAMVAYTQALQMMMQPPAPPETGKDGKPKPNGSAVDAAVKSGAIQPVGAGGTNVGTLVDQGILQPADGAAAAAKAAGPSIDDLMDARVLEPSAGGARPH